MTCRDVHHWYKANLNIVIIGGMALILLLCIWTICDAICKKEQFIKDLVDLTTVNEEGKQKLEINAQPLKEMQVNLESSHDSITTPNCTKLETTYDYHFHLSLFIKFPLTVDNN